MSCRAGVQNVEQKIDMTRVVYPVEMLLVVLLLKCRLRTVISTMPKS